MKKTRKHLVWILPLALLSALALSMWLAASSLVENEVRKRASRLDLTVQINSIEVGLGGVILRDVIIRSFHFPGQQVRTEEVNIRTNWFNPKSVTVRRGSVKLSGSWKKLREMYREWKNTRKRNQQTGEDGPGLAVNLSEFGLEWEGPVDGYVLMADGISLSKEGVLSARAESVSLKSERHTMSVKNLGYVEGNLVLRAESIDVTVGDPPGGKQDGSRETKQRAVMDRILGLPKLQIGLETSNFSASWDGKTVETGELETSVKTAGETEKLKITLRARDVRSPMGSYQELSLTLGIKRNEKTVRAEAEVKAGALVTAHPALTKGKVGLDHFRLTGGITAGPAGLSTEKLLLEVGRVPIEVKGEYGRHSLSGQMSLASVPCQHLLDSIPKGMVGSLREMKLEGSLSMNVQIQVDLPDRAEPSVRMALENGCKVKNVPDEFNVSGLMTPFEYGTYGHNGKPGKNRTSGPGSRGWIPLQLVSRFVPVCVRTMEDPGFQAHSGFHVEAIENSMKENIRTGRFVRGASTLSMQLAKNLWLQRERTAARKLQEAFLTIYLEQELTKEQILELYINVVEFGPNVYGLKAAAHHYFRTHPINLTLGQSLFLASILPKPTAHYFMTDGKLTPRKAMQLRGMMKAMWARGIISEDEYQEGTREVLVFKHPSTSSENAQEEIPVNVDGIDPKSWD